MNEQLLKLIELQDVDSKVDEANNNIQKIDNELNTLQETLKKEKEQIETLKKELSNSAVSKKEKEIEITTLDDKLKKHNMELNAVKTNEAYKALLTEIENCRSQKLKIEDELLSIMENEERLSREIKDLQNEYLKLEKEFNDRKISADEELKKTNDNIANFTNERKTRLDNLPAHIAGKYENIRKNKKGLAVVPIVNNNSCGGCHRNLPLHIIDEVRKGNELVVCNNCQRILYQNNHNVEGG
ncbi:MAG: C4-type zinc ribbon domain-containing protein [Elusimicrobiota bacterium]